MTHMCVEIHIDSTANIERIYTQYTDPSSLLTLIILYWSKTNSLLFQRTRLGQCQNGGLSKWGPTVKIGAHHLLLWNNQDRIWMNYTMSKETSLIFLVKSTFPFCSQAWLVFSAITTSFSVRSSSQHIYLEALGGFRFLGCPRYWLSC